MKLAYISSEKMPVPAVKGGAIQILIDGVSPFLSKKHQLTIFSVADPSLPKREKRNGVHYIRIPRKNYAQGVAKELKKHRFDVIHVFNRPKNIPLYKKSAPQSRFVISLHNEMFSEHKISKKRGRRAIRSVRKIMTVSDYIGQTVSTRFPEAKPKLQTVYSGVDLQTYRPVWSKKAKATRRKLRKKYGVRGKKVILFVGRLSKTKGAHVLIKAMKHVIKKHKRAVLIIVGSKWFSDNRKDAYIRSLYRLAQPLKDHVIFTEYVPADKMADFYLIGDIFVCPSQWQEPLARVHYEAMAAGLPVITTKRGGNPEIIVHNENGIVISNYKRPRAFARTINRFLSNPDLASKMARKGRKIVESHFDFQHVAKRLENVYLSVSKKK